MRIDYAFLADAAQFTPDSKLWVLGGEFRDVRAPSFPATLAALSVVVKLLPQPEECGREHRLRIRFRQENGNEFLPEIDVPFTPSLSEEFPDEAVPTAVALNLQQVLLPAPGRYTFSIAVDDVELASLRLLAKVVPESGGAAGTVRSPQTTQEEG